DDAARGLARLAAVEHRDAVDRRAVRVDPHLPPRRRALALALRERPADLAARLLEDRRVDPGRVAHTPRLRGREAGARVDREELAVLAELVDPVGVLVRVDRLSVDGVGGHARGVQQLIARA